MPEKWTGQLIGKMHNARVTYDDIARKLGVGKSYVSMVLNGLRTPKDAKQRFNAAFDEIIAERKAGQSDAQSNCKN